MVEKRVLSPGRVRRVPKQFSWVDHCHEVRAML